VIDLTEGCCFDTIANFAEGDGIVTYPNRQIAPADLNVVNRLSGDAFILYGDDLLAVAKGAAGMLQIGEWQAPGTNRLDALV
jgi:predicted oxidoreductase (fatty acid repression mutant protein)